MSTTNYVVPQGEMQGGFNAPASEAKEKRKDIQLLPAGPNSAVIFAVVDLGSHMETYQNQAPELKRKIIIGFEHPQLKQLFYLDDQNPRSSTNWLEGTFAVNSKAKLRKVIEAVVGRAITDQEAYAYDISKLLGARILANIAHYTNKKSELAMKVDTVMAQGQMPLPVNFVPELEYHSFSLDSAGNNFKTMNFAKLPAFLKKKLLDSSEGKAYAHSGGAFAQLPTAENQQGQQQGQSYSQQPVQQYQQQPQGPQGASAPQGQRTLVFMATDFSYDSYKLTWTDDQLVEAGKARWEYLAPAGPSAPQGQAPMPNAPQGPQGPTNTQAQQQAAPQQNFQQQQAPQGNSFGQDDDNDVPF